MSTRCQWWNGTELCHAHATQWALRDGRRIGKVCDEHAAPYLAELSRAEVEPIGKRKRAATEGGA